MSANLRGRVIDLARGWIGTPYHAQASACGPGCDCLGLVRGVWRDLYGAEPCPVPPYTSDWGEIGEHDPLLEALRRHMREVPLALMQPGDVLVFRLRPGMLAKHAGILLAERRMVHATETAGVHEAPLGPWWRRRIAGVFAFPALN